MALLEDEEKVQVKSCMEDLGFEYEPAPIEVEQLTGHDTVRRAFRSRFGYGEVPQDPALNSVARSDEERFSTALFGQPGQTVHIDTPVGAGVDSATGGCFAEARARIFGSVKSYGIAVVVARDFSAAMDSETSGLPGIEAANKGWAGCMRDAGYEFASPRVAALHFLDLRQAALSKSPVKGEVEVALADATCQESTGYIDTLNMIRMDFVRGLSTADADYLKQSRDLRDQAVAVIRENANGD